MTYRKMMLVGLLCLILWGIIFIGGVAAQSNNDGLPPIAWIEFGGGLWLFQSETGVSLASDEDVRCASFSPQQTYIAYLTSQTVAVMRLSDHEIILNLPVNGLTSPSLHLTINGRTCPIWLDETSLVFSTVFFSEPYGMPAYNLFRLNINRAELTEVLPFDEGGAISLSPNRQYLVILKPGVYANSEKPGNIHIIDSTTFQPINDSFDFAPVATAAEYLWVPTIFWKADSTSFAFGLPNPDLIYSLEQTPSSNICYMTVDDQPALCQQYKFDFWGPVFNGQLTRVAYTQRSGANQVSYLVYGEILPDAPQELSEIPFSATTAKPILWLDDDSLLFSEYPKTPQDLSIVKFSTGEVQRWPAENSDVEQPVIALQPFGDNLYLLAIGDYREAHSIGVYNAEHGTFTKLAEMDSFSTVVFADR